MWKAVWSRFGAVLGKTTCVSDVHWTVTINGGHHRFLCCEVRMLQSQLSKDGSVMLGLVSGHKFSYAYSSRWMKGGRSTVAEQQVRYICGVFPRGKEDTEKLFKELNWCEGALFFQPFWIEDADDRSAATRLTHENMAAVADRFQMEVPNNVKYVAVYPAYVVVRGPL